MFSKTSLRMRYSEEVNLCFFTLFYEIYIWNGKLLFYFQMATNITEYIRLSQILPIKFIPSGAVFEKRSKEAN